ncbi:OmpA family protein [Flavobacterium silvaticum]|uniref:OmpA family protein n=1 Tax=Flavobacterium silvaticum TaxID=1852020 RepID=A0A972FNI2_9FLAO|nr:OmpA family protein [Flavobacterium silvaticum]NMH28968.1 OmpA family protein [Flavobacterium silvaticum]
MKKKLLFLSIGLLTLGNVSAQNDPNEDKESGEETPYNRWTIEASAGQSKGMRPYSTGYYSSNPDNVLGSINFNSFSLGARYMLSPKFGVRLDGTFDKFENNTKTDSKPFEVNQLRFDLQGVVNASRLLNLEEVIGRFGLLGHFGVSYSRMTPKLDTGYDYDLESPPSNYDRTENNIGIVFGLTPQFRVIDRLAIFLDVSTVYNFRQHFAWDGHYSSQDENLQGQLLTAKLGLSYSFGSEKMHGDWGVIEDKRMEEIDQLDKRIGELETMMNDADKDGVPDYLDVENNSIAGVAVDTKGRMVDLNQNGIPDELEKFVNQSVQQGVTQSTGAAKSEVVKELINEGYIAVFFDFGSTKPTLASTENVAFILNYMRNNPSATADITGYADEIGNTDFNKSLSGKRAENIRDVLIKAGIDGSRLTIVPAGEDTSVDKNSDMARRLVRKATFHIK